LKEWPLLLTTVACTIVLAALSWHGFEKLWLAKPSGNRKMAV
jgi:peptidoglycan/LPS O-acetylase OafA/YrhL